MNRPCCFIPDQTRLDEPCDNASVYEVWIGTNPTMDSYTECCAAHLHDTLAEYDETVFTVYKIDDKPQPPQQQPQQQPPLPLAINYAWEWGDDYE